LVSRVGEFSGFHRHDQISWLAMVVLSFKQPQVSTEIRNWDVVAKALEAAARMYISNKPDTFWFVLVHSPR
jgi:hypothetical protein